VQTVDCYAKIGQYIYTLQYKIALENINEDTQSDLITKIDKKGEHVVLRYSTFVQELLQHDSSSHKLQ
jgi:hypothetical protein